MFESSMIQNTSDVAHIFSPTKGNLLLTCLAVKNVIFSPSGENVVWSQISVYDPLPCF